MPSDDSHGIATLHWGWRLLWRSWNPRFSSQGGWCRHPKDGSTSQEETCSIPWGSSNVDGQFFGMSIFLGCSSQGVYSEAYGIVWDPMVHVEDYHWPGRFGVASFLGNPIANRWNRYSTVCLYLYAIWCLLRYPEFLCLIWIFCLHFYRREHIHLYRSSSTSICTLISCKRAHDCAPTATLPVHNFISSLTYDSPCQWLCFCMLHVGISTDMIRHVGF